MCTDCAINIHVCISCTHINIDEFVRMYTHARTRTHTQDHSCVLHSIVGWDCVLGAWSRIEGYPCDPNPNDPLASVSSESLFNEEGHLNPSITILGT